LENILSYKSGISFIAVSAAIVISGNSQDNIKIKKVKKAVKKAPKRKKAKRKK